jgi:hypothetical protein
VEFFFINSNADPDGTTSTSVQGQWLRARLAESTARWKLVVLHHPPYSSDAGGAGNPGFRWPYASWGASAVFSGHDHIYARIHTNGIPYFINGLGGHTIDAFGSPTSAAAFRYRSDYGAMRLEATESNLICQFVSRSSLVADAFVLGSPVVGPIILAPPLNQTVIAGRVASFDVMASGAGPLRYQWQKDGTNILNATNRAFAVTNVQIAHEGDYSILVSGGSFTNRSRTARLDVARQPIIVEQPADIRTGAGSNVIFRVAADGFGPLSFQWVHGGQALPDALSSNLYLANVQLADTGGYAVRVTDQIGSTTSRVATLMVLARPVVTVHPLSQSAAPGETIILSAEATGTQPLSFSWRRNRTIITNQIIDGSVSFFMLSELQLTNAGEYQVGVTNVAGIAVGGLSAAAVITVLADSDGDGMPDQWETIHSFLATDPTDAAADFDGDGQSNLAEYLAGTDPTSFADRLMIDARRELDGTILLQFQAASNKTYALEHCEALHPDYWKVLLSVTAAPTNRILSLTDRSSQSAANRFYRIVTPNSQR